MVKRLEKKAAVIFDCDGTLLSTQNSVLLAAREFLKGELGRPVSAQEVHEAYTPDMMAFAQYFKLDISTPERAQALLARWAELLKSFKTQGMPFPGIKELLADLSALELELYVWTARDRLSTRRLLSEAKLLPYFLDMRCVDDCTPKPHPEGIEELVNHLQDKSRIFVIGDSFTDIQGARAYGARAMGAIWEGSSRPQSLNDHGAEALFQTPEEFGEFLKSELI